MNDKQALLLQLQSARFALWELSIFLDTHPENRKAFQMMQEYQKKNDALTKKYEELYGPLTSDSGSENRWEWITEPWPWENEANAEEVKLDVDL